MSMFWYIWDFYENIEKLYTFIYCWKSILRGVVVLDALIAGSVFFQYMAAYVLSQWGKPLYRCLIELSLFKHSCDGICANKYQQMQASFWLGMNWAHLDTVIHF